MGNKPGSQTSEFKLTLTVVVLVVVLLGLTLSGVVSMERLKAEVPAALLIVGGLVAGAYNVSRGLAKFRLPPPEQSPDDGGGDGGAR